MAKDYYGILGVNKSATEQEVKSAYRKLALQWHPDKHKGDKDAETKFKEINEAYEILSDPQKRKQYDTFGSVGGGQGFGGYGGQAGGFDFSGFGGGGDFADIFESFFGGGGGARGGRTQKRNTARRGNDIEATIEIAFEEAVFGAEKELEITKPDKCENCNGSGAEPGSPIVNCNTCQGTGEIRQVRNTILGQVSTSRICNVCNGEGKIPEKKCQKCHGTMRVRTKERVKVKIPAGIDNGSTIRLTGKGEAGIKGGSYGDLYIHLNVRNHEKFFRSGADIHSELPIHVLQAVMGAEVEVDTIHGKQKVKIPHGTEDGTVFKVGGFGSPHLNSANRGDHFAKVKIEIPKKLKKTEKELYQKLAEEAEVDIKGGGLFW